MIDFTKLMNRTPEESRAAREKLDIEFREKTRSLVASRMAIIRTCALQTDALSSWEAQFVESMVSKSEAVDRVTQMIGGELSYLSDSQVSKLSSIHSRLSSSIKEDSGLIETKKRTQYPRNRM